MPEFKDMSEITTQKGYLAYSRDVIHPHSKAAKHLIDLVINHFDLAFEDGRKGRQIVWNNSKCTPLIYACDTTPLTIPDISRFGNSEMIPKAEAFFQIPAETCAMVKAILGGFYEFRDSPAKKVVSTGLRCEPELEAIYIVEAYGYEPYIMDIAKIPNRPSQDRLQILRDQFRSEYLKLAKYLSGHELDKDKLHEELVRANRVRVKLNELDTLFVKHNLWFRSIPVLLARCGAETYFGQPDLYESILDEMKEELLALPDGAYHNEKLVKICWSGARGVDFSVYNAVDLSGAQIVGWNLPTPIRIYYNEEIDPLEALLDWDMSDKGATSMADACYSDERLMEDTGAKGIVQYTTLGCTFLTVNVEVKRKHLTQKGLPVLVLTGTSQIGETTGQTMTRLKAFVEMLS